jgi:acetate kinase
MSPVAYSLPIPLAWQHEYKIRKSGWHGIAHEQAARLAAKELKQSFKRLKLLSCYLGEESSLVAFKNGQIMDFVGAQSLTDELFSGHNVGSFNWQNLDFWRRF